MIEHGQQEEGGRHEPNVLVVEDDWEINELVGAYVEIGGYHYLGATTGNEGLQAVTDRSPALVILDVMLPDMDGFEICRRIKSDPATRATPVIMLTALDRPELRQRGLDCGASEYLTKPFDPDRLLATIRAYAAPMPLESARH